MVALTGDGAYDRSAVYATMHERHPEAAVAAPPRVDAVLSDTASTVPTQRDHRIQVVAETERMAWQRSSGYNQRAKVEGQIGCWKQVFGPTLQFHTDRVQATEIAIAAAVLSLEHDRFKRNRLKRESHGKPIA
ncbi:hypothetical protein [Azospirillum sp. A29]|uniref:hypothetical protein n=1 Tax=unclassified Azospirillum TaxID=2630922 RepID=UPI00366E3D52